MKCSNCGEDVGRSAKPLCGRCDADWALLQPPKPAPPTPPIDLARAALESACRDARLLAPRHGKGCADCVAAVVEAAEHFLKVSQQGEH